MLPLLALAAILAFQHVPITESDARFNALRMIGDEAEQDRVRALAAEHDKGIQAQRELEMHRAVLQRAIDALQAYQRADAANINSIDKLRTARKAAALFLMIEKDPTEKKGAEAH